MRRELLYEGKAKKVFRTDEKNVLLLHYKDDATAFNGKRKAKFLGKGRLNNEITSRIFPYLQSQGIQSHFIRRLNETEQLVHETKMIPLEVVVRNRATGSIVKRLGLEEGMRFQPPIVELFYKNDALDDPLMNDQHSLLLSDITVDELKQIKTNALKVNTVLTRLYQSIHLELIDFKLEFGRLADGTIILADEISPDTCRLWDIETKKKMDKDVFRQGTGDLITIYEEILNRLEKHS